MFGLNIAVCVVIVAVVLLRLHEWREGYSAGGEHGISFALFFAKGFCEAMNEKGIGKFLTRDYYPPLPLSYEDIADTRTAHKKLRYILDDIMRSLELYQRGRQKNNHGQNIFTLCAHKKIPAMSHTTGTNIFRQSLFCWRGCGCFCWCWRVVILCVINRCCGFRL